LQCGFGGGRRGCQFGIPKIVDRIQRRLGANSFPSNESDAGNPNDSLQQQGELTNDAQRYADKFKLLAHLSLASHTVRVMNE
jgi:hypothetical protein